MFYIAHTHLNYSKQEFWEATHSEICRQWKAHTEFNGWSMKGKDEDVEYEDENYKYKRMNIADVSFL